MGFTWKKYIFHDLNILCIFHEDIPFDFRIFHAYSSFQLEECGKLVIMTDFMLVAELRHPVPLHTLPRLHILLDLILSYHSCTMHKHSNRKLSEPLCQRCLYHLASDAPDSCDMEIDEGKILKKCETCKRTKHKCQLVNRMRNAKTHVNRTVARIKKKKKLPRDQPGPEFEKNKKTGKGCGPKAFWRENKRNARGGVGPLLEDRECWRPYGGRKETYLGERHGWPNEDIAEHRPDIQKRPQKMEEKCK